MVRDNTILWIDLETTGSADDERVLEIGALLTDASPELKEISYFSWVVGSRHDLDLIDNPIVISMHTKSGLWDNLKQINRELTPEFIDTTLNEWLDLYVPGKEHIPLGGSGVGHFDRKYIKRDYPNLNKRLTYWNYDIGVPRRFFEIAGLPWLAEQKTHRAIDDVRFHVAEARFFLEALQEI